MNKKWVSPDEGFFQNTDLLIAIAKQNLVVTRVNPRWGAWMGDPGGIGSSLANVLPDDIVKALRNGSSWRRAAFPFKALDGRETWLEPDIKRVENSLHVVLIDVTEAILSMRVADEARRARDLLLQDASVGTWLYDPDEDAYDFSSELHRLTPLSATEPVGRVRGRVPRKVMDSLWHPDDLLVSRPARERIVREGGTAELELRLKKPSSSDWDHVRVLMRAGPRRPSGLYEMYGLTQTITELAHARDEARLNTEKVSVLASSDPLTGMANRRAFEERLRGACAAASRGATSFGVLFLDLDRFKEVNDTLGHQAGDDLICMVGRRLASLARSEDTVARIGGDEFAVLQHGVTPAGAASLATRIVESLSGPVELRSGSATLSCSVGVAYVDRSNLGHEEALRQADLALYRAKAAGRGCYCIYEPEMDAAIKARRGLEHDLRLALADGRVYPAYQPIVDENGKIIALEALARWDDPLRGAVSPSAFIPLAEENDLIDLLWEVMVRAICVDLHRFGELSVGVNISPVQLRRSDFVTRLLGMLDSYNASASQFNLEITERCLLEDDNTTQTVLSSLRTAGFRLALDDFGTGYSSLSYLPRYPIQQLKLDRSFLFQLNEGERAKAVIGAVVNLAEALKLDLIAEGVESSDQLELLLGLGVHRYQGFLFSKAVAATDIQVLLRPQLCSIDAPLL